MSKFQKIKIGDLLTRYKNPINIENSKKYKRVKIRIKHQGISLRDEELGLKIGTKKQFTVKGGQFLMSKIDARYGAFGIVSLDLDKAIITGNFWAYDVNERKLNTIWFNKFINSKKFYDLCERASSGITHRKYLDEKLFLSFELNLPTIEEQKKTALLFVERDKIYFQLNHINENQKKILVKLRQTILKESLNRAHNSVLLSDICDFTKGSSPIQKTQAGQYPLVTTGNERKSSGTFQFDTKAVCIPLVSSTGHGSKSLNYIHYQEGKFALGTILVALTAKDPKIINMKFLHHFLFLNKDNLIVSLMKGMANVTVPIGELKKIRIPLPDIKEQEKFEMIMKKLDELENNIGNNEKNADLLMQAILQESMKHSS